jgi:hypothetical protein
MKKFERFWNIVFYFVWRGLVIIDRIINIPFNLIYKIPSMQRRFKRHNFDPKEVHERIWNNGFNIWWSGAYTLLLMILVWMSISLPIVAHYHPEGRNGDIVLGIFITVFIFLFFFNAYLLVWKDKYIKYFREFKRKPHQWKVKWAWISLAVILIPILMFALSMKFLMP